MIIYQMQSSREDQKKKQPNEDSVLNILESKMESLTKAKLDSELNKLISGKGFIINLIVETIHITYTNKLTI